MPEPVLFGAVLLFCLTAVILDLRSGKIPNFLTYGGLVLGLVLSYLLGGAGGLSRSLTGALLGFSILLIPFLGHMVGGGDVKFLIAAGALVGWKILWISFLAGAVIGGLMAVILLLRRDRTLHRFRGRLVLFISGSWRKPTMSEGEEGGTASIEDRGSVPRWRDDVSMPYAVPLSLGIVIVASVHLLI